MGKKILPDHHIVFAEEEEDIRYMIRKLNDFHEVAGLSINNYQWEKYQANCGNRENPSRRNP